MPSDRAATIRRLALTGLETSDVTDETLALGLTTNRAFLIDCLEHPQFASGGATTAFIGANFSAIAPPAPDRETLALAAVLLFEAAARSHGHAPEAAWSSSGPIAWPMRLSVDDGAKPVAVTISVAAGSYRVEQGGHVDEISIQARQPGSVRWRADGKERGTAYVLSGDTLHIKAPAGELSVRDVLYAPPSAEAGTGSGELRAPMNGRIVAVLAAVGDTVEKGQRLVILEAMKMQHEMVAATAGRLAQVMVKPGDQVATRQVLAVVEPPAGPRTDR